MRFGVKPSGANGWFYTALCCVLLGIGVLCRGYLFSHPKNLWIDEAMLAYSVYAVDWATVFSGYLPFMQSAPLGFLSATRLLASCFGTSEMVLTFIPVVASVLTLLLAFVQLKKMFSARLAAVYLCIFCSSYALLLFSVEFKQYAVECFLTLFIFFVYLKYSEAFADGHIPWPATWLLILSILFSTSVIFVVAGVFLSILCLAAQRRNVWKLLRCNLPQILLPALLLALYYLLYLKKQNSTGMQSYWGAFFLPSDMTVESLGIFVSTIFYPLTQRMVELSNDGYINAIVASTFFIGLYLLRKNTLVLFPIMFSGMVIFTAFLLRVYPLGYGGSQGLRLILFYLPLLYIPIAYFMDWCLQKIEHKSPVVAVLLVAALVVHVGIRNYYTTKSGVAVQQMSGHVQRVNELFTQDSGLVLYELALPGYLYYQHRNNKTLPYEMVAQATTSQERIAEPITHLAAQGKDTIYILVTYDPSNFYAHARPVWQEMCGELKVEEAHGTVMLTCRRPRVQPTL